MSVIVSEDGSQAVYSWHKTVAAAYTAARTGYTGKVAATHGGTADVLLVVPTAIKGKLGDWHPEVNGWGDIPASAFTELVAAKVGTPAPAKKAPKAKAKTELTDEERRAKAAADRRRQRAAKRDRDALATRTDKNQVVRDGKLVWRNSGEAHNAYRRARRAALKAQAEAK